MKPIVSAFPICTLQNYFSDSLCFTVKLAKRALNKISSLESDISMKYQDWGMYPLYSVVSINASNAAIEHVSCNCLQFFNARHFRLDL